MLSLLMIADDFTGALDTGVQFAAAGVETRVVVGSQADLAVRAGAVQVLVIDAETRHLPPEQAYTAVEGLVRQAEALGVPYIYKKTDSALRGNIGAELTALLRTSGCSQLPFLPAYPKVGRTTQGGVHLVKGVPVAQSVFGQDPFEPVRHSGLAEIIGEQSGVPVHLSPALKEGDPLPEEEGILVFDGADDQELARTGRELLRGGRLHIMAGCAGFAGVLPQLLGLRSEVRGEMPRLDQRLLVICGSVNPITVTGRPNRASEIWPPFRSGWPGTLVLSWTPMTPGAAVPPGTTPGTTASIWTASALEFPGRLDIWSASCSLTRM